MIVLLDNYDSFTYNLYQYLCEFHPDVMVIRNDHITADEVAALQPQAIIFSPGPGRPENAGHMESIIARHYRHIPMLGICLGHQAIAHVFRSNITHAKQMKHGEMSLVHQIAPSLMFEGIPSYFEVGRYHSLIVNQINEAFEVTAVDEDGEIMAFQHRHYPLFGLQFHPESILTPQGKQLLENFMKGMHIRC